MKQQKTWMQNCAHWHLLVIHFQTIIRLLPCINSAKRDMKHYTVTLKLDRFMGLTIHCARNPFNQDQTIQMLLILRWYPILANIVLAFGILLNRNDDEAGVIVLNPGLHCNDRTCMDKYMDDKFVPLYNAYTKVHQQNFFLLWREHEPQHFDNPASSGLYEGRYLPQRCTGNINHFDNF